MKKGIAVLLAALMLASVWLVGCGERSPEELWATAKPMLCFCLPLVPATLCWWITSVSDRYIELYEHIVGQKFNKADNHDDLAARIEKNVTEYLNQK